MAKEQNRRWLRGHRPGARHTTRGLVEFLVSPSMANIPADELWRKELATLLLKYADLIARLKPAGKFHRQTLGFVLAHPAMTPKLREGIAQQPHLLPHII